MKIVAMVVVYNKKCSESNSLGGLKRYGDGVEVVVFDNSTEDFGNKEYCRKNGYKYYARGENVGLSRAYNYVIRRTKCDYIVILDDDTTLNEKYFYRIKELANTSKYDVVLPVVKSGDVIISPSEIQFGCRVKVVKNVNALDMKRVTAINSGMMVKRELYDVVEYDEEMFLDYVDHEFMRRIRGMGAKIKVMTDVTILQNFSMLQRKDSETERRRFEIYKRDFCVYCKRCKNKLYYFLNIWQYKRRLLNKYGGRK